MGQNIHQVLRIQRCGMVTINYKKVFSFHWLIFFISPSLPGSQESMQKLTPSVNCQIVMNSNIQMIPIFATFKTLFIFARWRLGSWIKTWLLKRSASSSKLKILKILHLHAVLISDDMSKMQKPWTVNCEKSYL